MTRREFAERFLILGDDYSWDCMPVGQVIAAIYEIEYNLASGEIADYIKWLEDEIEEYDGDEDTQDHADAAKELLTALKGGEVHD